MTNKERVLELKSRLCDEVQKEFKFIGGDELEFKRPFNIYLTESPYDDMTSRGKYTVKSILEGKWLQCSVEDSISLLKNNVEYLRTVDIRDVEDVVEVAHILDELQSDNIKILYEIK